MNKESSETISKHVNIVKGVSERKEKKKNGVSDEIVMKRDWRDFTLR